MSYKSDIDLGLGLVPEIKDNPQVFIELQGIYNALHTLSASVSNVAGTFDASDPDSDPSKVAGFKTRSFWVDSGDSIKAGDIVSPLVDYSRLYYDDIYQKGDPRPKGFIRGAATAAYADRVDVRVPRPGASGDSGVTHMTVSQIKYFTIADSHFGTCIALTDAEPGERVQVGMGKSIFNINAGEPGDALFAKLGMRVTGYTGNSSSKPPFRLIRDGSIYIRAAPDTDDDPTTTIGVIIAPGKAMLY